MRCGGSSSIVRRAEITQGAMQPPEKLLNCGEVPAPSDTPPHHGNWPFAFSCRHAASCSSPVLALEPLAHLSGHPATAFNQAEFVLCYTHSSAFGPTIMIMTQAAASLNGSMVAERRSGRPTMAQCNVQQRMSASRRAAHPVAAARHFVAGGARLQQQIGAVAGAGRSRRSAARCESEVLRPCRMVIYCQPSAQLAAGRQI